MVLWPGEAAGAIAAYFASQRSLNDENAALRRQLVDQAPAMQSYPLLRSENEQLKALLELKARYPEAATAVEVLYTGRDPFSQKLFVDKGSDAGLQAGEAVIDAQGVVGQVTRVYGHMAEVTLITDKDHAVPVKVERSGVRSVLFGAGAGRLPELRFVAPNADVKVGDTLVTSGIDGTYPAGLAVAQIASLERDTGQMFARIGAMPLAGADRSRHLLVLKQPSALPPRPQEPEQVTDPKRGKGKPRRGREL